MPSPPLDVCIEQLRVDPGRTWGPREAVYGLLVVPLVLVASGALLVAAGLPLLAAAAGSTAAVGGAVVLLAQRAAAQSGGWERALGLDAPLWSDTWRIVRWTVALLLLEGVLAAVLVQVVPALSGARASNTDLLGQQSAAGLLVFAVLAVTVAPVLEELLFRGLVLRGLMLRLGFWPAALASSAVFGLLHATALDASGLLVVLTIGLLGVGLCLLARSTGRLGPSIGVHALHNAVAVLVVAATA
jgi:membrane protease YdiL (CAAX protease family)